MSEQTALLVLDAQVNMFAEASPVFEGEALLHRMSYLITKARAAHVPIIYIQNNGGECDPDRPGTAGWFIHPAIAPLPGDVVIQKHTPDAFFETGLHSELERRGIKKLIVMGLQTEICIDATCHRAFALGYDISLIKDAHSTFDTAELTAAQMIERYNRQLAAFASVIEADKLLFD